MQHSLQQGLMELGQVARDVQHRAESECMQLSSACALHRLSLARLAELRGVTACCDVSVAQVCRVQAMRDHNEHQVRVRLASMANAHSAMRDDYAFLCMQEAKLSQILSRIHTNSLVPPGDTSVLRAVAGAEEVAELSRLQDMRREASTASHSLSADNCAALSLMQNIERSIASHDNTTRTSQQMLDRLRDLVAGAQSAMEELTTTRLDAQQVLQLEATVVAKQTQCRKLSTALCDRRRLRARLQASLNFYRREQGVLRA